LSTERILAESSWYLVHRQKSTRGKVASNARGSVQKMSYWRNIRTWTEDSGKLVQRGREAERYKVLSR